MKELKITGPIISKILFIRGKRVMIDADLAKLYGVSTKRLNEQVKRNLRRFPEEFMFRLTENEKKEVVAKCDHLFHLRFSHVCPYAFTEYGALMLANVLNSIRAMKTSIQIVKVFVQFREILLTHKELAEKLGLLEQKIGKHDQEIKVIIEAIQQLIAASHQHPKEEPPKEEPPKRRIGFHRYD